jgi:GAF domain-containing protein
MGALRLAFPKRRKAASRASTVGRNVPSPASPRTEGAEPASAPPSVGAYEGLRAVTSLSRAFSGSGTIEDTGALAWIILRQAIPSDAIAIFVTDDDCEGVSVHFTAGLHADRLRGAGYVAGAGIAGCVFEHLRPVLNANPALEFGDGVTRPLRWCVAVPLVDGDSLAGVLALYRASENPYTDADVRLLELLAPRLASSVLDSRPVDQRNPPVAPPPPVPELQLLKRG